MTVGTPTRHLEMIEGQKTLVVDRRPPLQPSLDRLLAAIYMVTQREDIRPAGARLECEVERTHRMAVLREGRHVGLDGLVRDLRVEMCRDCGACCVRDISFQTSVGGERVPRGRKPPQRGDIVIGWYSGARRRQREFK